MYEDLEIFTSRGKTLICIVKNPGITIKGLSGNLFLTRRSIWSNIGELRRLNYLLAATQKGTRQELHYSISPLGLSKLRELLEE